MTNRKDKNTQQLVELIKSRNSEKFDEFLEEHKPFEDCFYLSYKSQPLIYIAIKAENENAAIKLINEIKVFNKEHLNRKYNNKTFLHYAISDNLLSVGKR
ncbi:hypothetical protein [Wolbachia endosymbiont of Chironomus riparius]|uniref:hypothetical protein n=1 Tax=Wolbachia endosymbiont of Chironomus riparius TaxID=2883238 RepID=UPI00209D22A1|nr:hypothetical protein [Wolbachia endosymbiont of Chironomus riparius]